MLTRELNLKLGEILLEKGKLSRGQLDSALKEQRKRGFDQKRVGSFLIDLGLVTEDDVTRALGMQFNLP